MYKTPPTVHHHISKQQEEIWKYNAQQSINEFSTCLGLQGNSVSIVQYISSINTETKEKMEK